MGKTAVVFIDGVIDNGDYINSASAVRSNLEWQGQFDNIQVTINSCGGDIAEGLAIYDLLRSYDKPITTVVMGQCCSAATVVFLAGDTRLIFENVVNFMVHQATAEIHGTFTAEGAHLIGDFIDAFNQRIRAIYSEKTKATEETITEWLSKDSFMTADEALANGFATAISKPVQAKFYAKLPTEPAAKPVTEPVAEPVAEPTSTNQPTIDSTMKIITDQAKRLATSVMARLSGTKVEAKKVTTDGGVELNIEYAGETFAEGDPVLKGTDPAPDGEYVYKGVKITVKDGKISNLNTDGGTPDVVAQEVSETEESEEEETEETETETAPTLESVQAENEQLRTQVTAQAKTLATVQAQMQLFMKSKESADPVVPAGKGKKTKVSAKATLEATDEDQASIDMRDERRARGLGLTLEQLRAQEEDQD